MAITVRVRNLQSVEDATVVLDGFTVITGPNNSGKTALLRAIRGVFTNAPPGALVRHGAEHLTVDIDFGDGNIVKWEKGAKVNRYTVNGKLLDNVGRGCPPEVEALGIRSIAAGTDRIWPQIADQFHGTLFLIGSPGSSIAEAIADVDRVGKLSAALKLAESDRRGIASTLKVRRKDQTALGDELATFDGLDTVATSVTALDEAFTEAATLAHETQVVALLQGRFTSAKKAVNDLEGIADISLPSAEAVAKATKVRDALRAVEALKLRHQTGIAMVSQYAGVADVPVPGDGTEATQAKTKLGVLLGLRSQRQAAQTVVNSLDGLGSVTLPSSDAGEKAKKLKETMGILQGFNATRGSSLVAIETLEGEVAQAAQDLIETEGEVTELLGGLGVCPTCRKPADTHTH